ncbi:kinase-like domain-containing protein [Nemania serpens]|nr:kinase-like domain-containing protein [Nemania serpens]
MPDNPSPQSSYPPVHSAAYTSLFAEPRLFSSNLFGLTSGGTQCNFITFLATVQRLDLEMFPLSCRSFSPPVGEGGTSQISQGFVKPETSFAFKRVSEVDKLRLDDDEIYRRLISELLVLEQEGIRGHPFILELQVHPTLIFEMSPYGDLFRFARSPPGRGLDVTSRLRICLQIGVSIATMHRNHVIHGDIKPQNVIIFKSEDGSFVPKVADFGYSTLMSEPDVTISLPQSHPWFAPEILEYPNFAPAQASLTDIFSYGMLCLWFIFEKSLSDVESSLTPAENTAGVRAMPDISDISVHKLSDMRRNNSSLIELSAHIISADRNLDAETKIRLRDFSHATLSYDPRERQPSLPRLLNFLGSIDDLIPEQVGSFGFNPPQASDFKVRSDTPLASQLGICYTIGFGNSSPEDQTLVQSKINACDEHIRATLDDSSEFLANTGMLLHTLVDTGFIEMMSTLADTYREHNVMEEAIAATRHDLESLNDLFGPEHPITVDLAGLMSLLTYSVGDWVESEIFARHNLNALERRFGLTDVAVTLRAKLFLAEALSQQGKWAEAEVLQKEVMNTCLNDLGKDNPLSLSSMAKLAATYCSQGLFEDAERLGVEVLNATRQLFSAEHQFTLEQASILAEIYHHQERLDEALELQLEWVNTSKTIFGLEHSTTVIGLSGLATMFWDNGDLEEGALLQFDALNLAKRIFGPEHPSAQRIMVNLAFMHEDSEDFEEAEKNQREVMDIRERTLGPEHPSTLTLRASLGHVLGKLGRYEEGLEMEMSTLATMKRVLGPDHPDTLLTMSNLACTRKDRGEDDIAAELMEKCIFESLLRFGHDHPRSLRLVETLHEWQSNNSDERNSGEGIDQESIE